MKSKFTFFISISLLLGCFISCKNEVNPTALPALTQEGAVVALIEIPAGTNRKIEYDYAEKRFQVDVIDGKDRVINFLPYPGNYGFIPSTHMDEDQGGDGDALDILVISESVATGDTIAVIPIGALMLNDGGEIDTKIIAVPADPAKRVMDVTDFETFSVKYSMAKNIIENWFLNYKGLGKTELIGWRNGSFALKEIEKWKK